MLDPKTSGLVRIPQERQLCRTIIYPKQVPLPRAVLWEDSLWPQEQELLAMHKVHDLILKRWACGYASAFVSSHLEILESYLA